ncbi:hypothetical protein [Amycolatopsis minnesotensis]|uniref:hypothetical protein n=1 Tax=Amycolatopsis minnesotensis TaxID=337894 RepID=UPI0031E39556
MSVARCSWLISLPDVLSVAGSSTAGLSRGHPSGERGRSAATRTSARGRNAGGTVPSGARTCSVATHRPHRRRR